MRVERVAGVVASVVLHGMVVAFALSLPRVPPKVRERVRIELVSRPPAPPPPPLTPPPVPTRPKLAKKQAPAPPPDVVAPAPAPVAETPKTTEIQPVSAPPPPPVVVAAAPPPSVAPPKPVDLFRAVTVGTPGTSRFAVPPAPKGSGRDSAFARLPGEGAGDAAATEAERITARVTGATLDANAKKRVEAGLVDPAYARLGRAMRDGWDPEKSLPENSAEMWVKRRAANSVVMTQLLLETAKNYARTGSPMADGETIDESVRSDLHDATTPQTGLDQKRQGETMRQYMAGKFDKGRSTHVLVTETPDGKVTTGLVQGSGDPEVDTGALADIRDAVLRLHEETGPPPTTRRSLWSLTLKIIINPPLPIGSFTFDEVLEAPKLELPLGRKLLKRIQLEAVYDDDPRLAPPPAGGL